MSHKRGAPVLIEVLRKGDASYSSRGGTIPPNPALGGGQSGKGGVSGPGGGSHSLPPGPASAIPMAASVGGGMMSGRKGSKYQLTMQHLLIGIGGLVVLLALVWFVAFKSGQSAADSKWVGKVPMGATSPDGATPAEPLDKPGPGDGTIDPHGNGGAGGVPIPDPNRDEFKPQPPRPEPQVQTQLVAGMNYLLVERFRRAEDADAAGRYLAGNGLTVMIAKGSELDVGSSSDWLFVVVLQPFEKPASDPEASKLRDRVQQLGRSWRAQNRLSPSDFSQPYWKKFVGKK